MRDRYLSAPEWRFRWNPFESYGNDDENAQRELHHDISEISESADVRAGSSLPVGTQERVARVNVAISSRDDKGVMHETS
jgi:hypothetical protein